jgi:uncharacterized protein YhbP (UPF0306 family)
MESLIAENKEQRLNSREKLKSNQRKEYLMIYASDLRDRISNLLTSQSLAVLATQKDGQSYANLVAFAVLDNLQMMIFATSRSTRKFSNIQGNPLVALLVDNRLNSPADFKDAIAVTAIGKAMEVNGSEKEKFSSMYLAKHPHLSDFISSPNQALLRVKVSKYIVVSNFQRVLEMDVDE